MRKRRADWSPWVIGVLTVALGSQAAGQGVTQEVPGHGKINWTEKSITATGSGAPSKKAKSPAAARLGAERAAKLSAYRNILEAVKGVQVSGERNAQDAMSNGQIKAEVDGIIQGAKVVDTVYYSDLSVDVVLQVPITGALTQALLPKNIKPVKVPIEGKAEHSGLIVDAKGLKVVPAIAPRVLDEKGAEVYGVGFVSEQARDNGIAGYEKEMDLAKKNQRVQDKPLVVKALSTAKSGVSDVVISNADADKLRGAGKNVSYLTEARVVFVID